MIDKKYKHILFDFDGTIADSSPGIFKAAKQTLKEYGIKDVADSEYRKMVGPPLKYSFKEIFHFSEDKIDEAMLFYRNYYKNNTLLDCNIYEGIPELFKVLYDADMKLYVATSKPESFAIKILEHFNLSKYFTMICGSDIKETHSSKVDVIKKLLSKNNISNHDECIMIGDRCFDVEGAKQVNISCIGVCFGFGSKEELESSGAIATAATPMDIAKMLL